MSAKFVRIHWHTVKSEGCNANGSHPGRHIIHDQREDVDTQWILDYILKYYDETDCIDGISKCGDVGHRANVSYKS